MHAEKRCGAGVPIAYPRMNAVETLLESKLNPLTILGKSGALGLSGFVNKFNKCVARSLLTAADL